MNLSAVFYYRIVERRHFFHVGFLSLSIVTLFTNFLNNEVYDEKC